jgi:hypothetical protein
MKKLSLLVSILLCLGSSVFGQQKWKDYSETYPQTFIGDSTQVGIVTCIEDRNDDFWSLLASENTSGEFLVSRGLTIKELSNNTFVNTFSATPAYFFVRNVNSTNSTAYEYRITDNTGKIIVPWSDITRFDTPGFGVGDGKAGEMAFLGGYKTDYGNRLIVEVRKKGSSDILSKAVAAWVAIAPRVTRVYTTDQLNEFFNDLMHEWVNRIVKYPDLSKLKSTQNNLIFILNSDISHKSQVEYEVEKNGKVYIPWRQNEFDNNFIWLKSLPHGKYKLKVRYTVQPEHIGICDFEIKPAWYQSTVIQIISGSLLTAFLGLIGLVVLLLRKNRKIIIESEKQKLLQTELQVIRAQLNPHFIFNALNSIQSLINKHDVEGANRYLAEFSMLLRNTLVNTELERLPLEKEITILDTYLKLEQLRFNFKYEIKVDSNINSYETELPSLLLQPLLENAVKHGLGDHRHDGELLLFFKRSGNDLIAIIGDNGNGFDTLKEMDGFGLKLTRKRIGLLNNSFTDRKIILDLNSSPGSSTEIKLTFINWVHED